MRNVPTPLPAVLVPSNGVKWCREHPIQVLNGDMCPACDNEIAKLEASMKRMDDIDPAEICAGEYARTLKRLVMLRELRDQR